MFLTNLESSRLVVALILGAFLGALAVRTEVNDTFIVREPPDLNLIAFRDGTISCPFIFSAPTPALMSLADPAVERLISSGAAQLACQENQTRLCQSQRASTAPVL